MNSGKILLGVLAGVAVGATLGILFAPDKGSATRKSITRKSNEYAEDLGGKFNDFIGVISKKAKKVRKEATRLAENEKKMAEDVIDELSTAVS